MCYKETTQDSDDFEDSIEHPLASSSHIVNSQNEENIECPLVKQHWSLSFGKEKSFSSDIVRKDGDGRETLKIDLPKFNMTIRALLDTGATTSTLGSVFTDKVKVGNKESARQFDRSAMKLCAVEKPVEIHLGDFYQGLHSKKRRSHRTHWSWE
jgi:hypothetical protein